MKRDRFKSGGLSGIAASLSSAVLLFAVFRITATEISIAAIGCWALVQGLFLIARIADSGAGSNITRVVAVQLEEEHGSAILRTAAAGLIISTLPMGILAMGIYWPVVAFVTHQYSAEVPVEVIASMGFASVLFGITSSASTILLAAYEGTHRLTEKNYAITAANFIALAICFPVLTTFGAYGIGIVYVTMSSTQLILSCFLLLSAHRVMSSGRNEGIVKICSQLWRENLQLSTVALIRLSFEPTTKLLLSFTATLPEIAAFELALRVATQIRVLGQSAVQPLLALGARRTTEMTESALLKFRRINQVVGQMSGRLAEVQILGAPIVSFAGLGFIDARFIAFSVLLVIANSINMAGLVGYFFQLSSGQLRPLLRIQLTMATLNAGIGVVAAFTLGSLGVVLAYALTFSYGGIASLRLLLFTSGSRISLYFREQWGRWLSVRIVGWTSVLVLSSSVFLPQHETWMLALSVAACFCLGAFFLRFVLNIRRRPHSFD